MTDLNGVGQWLQVEQLYVGANLTTADGVGARVLSIHDTGVILTTYNLEVADINTYFVSAAQVLVHNCGGRAKGGTYVLKDADGAVRKTGRTKNLDQRRDQLGRQHPELEFQVDKRTDSYKAQRGREQILHDRHSSAHRENGGLDRINGIRADNPKRAEYMRAGKKLGD